MVKFEDGKHEGQSIGNNGNITLMVEVVDGRIQHIEAVNHKESTGLFETCLNTMSQRIIDAQDVDVDAVSGATESSSAIQQAVKDALN